MQTDSFSGDVVMHDASLWKNNTYPGPNYQPRIVTLPRFKPQLKGRVQYDYVSQCFTFTVVRDSGNGVYIVDTMNFGTPGQAAHAKNIIHSSLGVLPQRIYGIHPESQVETNLPSLLIPKTVPGRT